jgi:ABC-type transport system substrate-binding protein
MTETLDGLFNPFFSTSASDGTIVSMTQIGMLTSDTDEKGDASVAFGEDYAVVVLDYSSVYDINEKSENPDKEGVTTYTFVIKNGLKFSDGESLNIEDVLFNMYVYLDPVYTGSSTMYSTDIQGLSQYRIQQNLSGSVNADEQLTAQARTKAQSRFAELINLFRQTAETPSGGYSTTEAKVREAINRWSLSIGYKEAVSANPDEVNNDQLLKDYEKTLELFRKELERDYEAAKEAYTDEPYKSHGFDEITSFMYMEGYVDVEFGEKDGKANADKSVILSVSRDYPANITTKEQAVSYVYDSKINSELHIILSAWATAQELQTLYMAQAKEVILKENMQDGELLYPNISGIVSLGHTTDIDSVTIGDKTYTVAHDHNADGTPANPDEYDVLQIKINGIDPKAVWNFSFAVAPQHYYAEGYTVDIANNNFGVDYASFDYMTNVIQSQRNDRVPMGGGAYMATNNQGDDQVTGNDF